MFNVALVSSQLNHQRPAAGPAPAPPLSPIPPSPPQLPRPEPADSARCTRFGTCVLFPSSRRGWRVVYTRLTGLYYFVEIKGAFISSQLSHQRTAAGPNPAAAAAPEPQAPKARHTPAPAEARARRVCTRRIRRALL